MSLIFKNCEKYNGAKGNTHMVLLGRHTAKAFRYGFTCDQFTITSFSSKLIFLTIFLISSFRKLFSTKMRSLERGGSSAKHTIVPTATGRESTDSKTIGKSIGKKRPLSPSQDDKPTKRVSIKVPSRAGSKSISGGKMAGGKKAARQSGKKVPATTSKLKIDLALPVPMHVAIASIKESYPVRRHFKDLEGWESDCLKFLKQLQKHPWISAERPKYIFHVPVEMIFPEIRGAYNAKIKHPMDLTTAEAKLLSGIYQHAEEVSYLTLHKHGFSIVLTTFSVSQFVSDIALIFSNALTFNKDGYEVGEPMSCAYYDASTHLLKYSRWLSLEILASSLSDSANCAIVDGCAREWSLTDKNRSKARAEMEDIVFNEFIDKTLVGDKYVTFHSLNLNPQ